MAVNTFYPVAPAGNGGSNALYSATLTGQSPIITPGKNAIVQIGVGSTAGVRLFFGTAENMAGRTYTANGILIPFGKIYIVDLGNINDSLVIYSTSATIVSVHYAVRN